MIPVWTERNKWVSQFIPEDSSVIDWGCGNKDTLRYITPKKYVGIDINPEADIITDFNQDIPHINDIYDIGLILGVLEYLDNPEHFIKSVQHSANTFLILCLLAKKKKTEWKNLFDSNNFANLLIPNFNKVSFDRKGNYILAICQN